MAQKNRPNMATDIITNIYNNIVKFITGQNAQDRFINLNDSCVNILSDANQANGYVATDANNEMLSGYYCESITAVDLLTKADNATLVINKSYLVTDANTSTKKVLTKAETINALFETAIDLENGVIGTYDVNTGVFTGTGVGSTPTLNAVLGAGNTSANPIIITDGTDGVTIKKDSVIITNGVGGEATISSPDLTDATEFKIPNKSAGTETFAMLSDITGGVPSLSTTTGGVGVASTSNTYSNGLLVPENLFTAGMMPLLRAWFEKSATNGNCIIRLYVNDTNNLAGSPILLATSTTFGATTRSSVHQRILNIIAASGAGSTKVQNTTFASNSDIAQFTTAVSSLNIDWTTVGGKYIVASAQNGSASDTTTVTAIKIDL